MKDLFSSHSFNYAKYRPVYPPEMFTYIDSFVHQKNVAWDCGTGNGQTAAGLSKYFTKVYATDISKEQIGNAIKIKNVEYHVEAAEQSMQQPNSVDLVTVSQALHWFDIDSFYKEVRKVCRTDAIIAAWTYNLLKIDPVSDRIISDFYNNTLDTCWDEARKHVDDGYARIPFPFRQIADPGFVIRVLWNLNELQGYLNTWSGVKKFISLNNYNPVPDVIKQLKENPGNNKKLEIVFPIHLKMGYVH